MPPLMQGRLGSQKEGPMVQGIVGILGSLTMLTMGLTFYPIKWKEYCMGTVAMDVGFESRPGMGVVGTGRAEIMGRGNKGDNSIVTRMGT